MVRSNLAVVVLIGGAADESHGAVFEIGLEYLGRIRGVVAPVGAHDAVYLVDIEDAVAVAFRPFEYLLHALLVFAVETGAGYQAGHVQGIDLLAVQPGGTFVRLFNHARQTIDEGRLAHTWFADEDHVVLVPAAEHADGALQFRGASDERVLFAVGFVDVGQEPLPRLLRGRREVVIIHLRQVVAYQYLVFYAVIFGRYAALLIGGQQAAPPADQRTDQVEGIVYLDFLAVHPCLGNDFLAVFLPVFLLMVEFDVRGIAIVELRKPLLGVFAEMLAQQVSAVRIVERADGFHDVGRGDGVESLHHLHHPGEVGRGLVDKVLLVGKTVHRFYILLQVGSQPLHVQLLLFAKGLELRLLGDVEQQKLGGDKFKPVLQRAEQGFRHGLLHLGRTHGRNQ